jgi:hypothetical protein
MKRREFNKSLTAATAVILSPFSRARNALAATVGGATPVFSYPSGFAGSSGAITLCSDAALSGSIIRLINNPGHEAAGAWYTTKQPPTSFTTQFTFQPSGLGSGPVQSGMTFCIQNTVSPPGAAGYVGTGYAGDANMCGYGGAVNQTPPVDSIAIKFDASNINYRTYPAGGLPSSTGLYFNGGPSVQGGSGTLGLFPFNDLNPYGINFYNGHTFQVTIVYDGSLITMVLLDTTTKAQARLVWPLNLANTTNATGNYVGFTAGTASVGLFELLTWSYWSGYNTRLATPTFSPAASQYSGTQAVTISYPSGSTCYYTTNGLLPTSSSTQYTGPITVSTGTVLQAVAIQSGFTDSLVATGNYQANTSYQINCASGFSANCGVVTCGYAYLSGSTIRLTDTVNSAATGAAWFSAPVNIQTFSTAFTLQFNSGASGNGMCYVIQSNPQAYSKPSNAIGWSGGPTVVGNSETALGYGGMGSGTSVGILNSIAIAFDLYAAPNSVGLYTNGATPAGSQITMTGITLNSGHAMNVSLSYTGTTLSFSITDTVTGAHFTHNFTIDIPSTVGANTAYVGFTGGTGGATAVQQVQSWTYTASPGQAPAVPAPPTNLRVQ